MVCLTHLMKVILKEITKIDGENYMGNTFDSINKRDLRNFAQIELSLTEFSENLGRLLIEEQKSTEVEGELSSNSIYFKNLNNKLNQLRSTKKDKLQLGLFATHILVSQVKYKKMPVLKIVKKTVKSKKTANYLRFDEDFVFALFEDLQKTSSLTIQNDNALPMIYPPTPWKSLEIGGYYLRESSMAKIFPGFQEAKATFNQNNLSSVVDVLNTMNNVPWRINTRILDVIEYYWALGTPLKGLPKRFNSRVVTKEMLRVKDFKEKIMLLKESQNNRELHSLRCDFMLKLAVAKEFANIDKIYFPNNLDFRGRVYPLCPHLNHIGSDICRGLLEFSEAKPLGKTGLRWLKIHLANVIGNDKISFDEREKYGESLIDKVHQVAEDPSSDLFWTEVDSPWQTLATIFELSNALKSGNPEEYKTRLHVHVDGSCNGLQHYSALGRDYNGGYEVNLVDRELPGDVYTGVLKIVLDKIQKETNPNDIKYAELLKKHQVVNRKVIKQTVMTSVYGVTLVGARDQIKKQLKEKKLFDPQTLFYISLYLAKKTIESIGDLFNEANGIKTWLTKSAMVVSNSGNTVKWTTPLGLPCIQPYKKLTKTDIVRTHAEGFNVISDFDTVNF